MRDSFNVSLSMIYSVIFCVNLSVSLRLNQSMSHVTHCTVAISALVHKKSKYALLGDYDDQC